MDMRRDGLAFAPNSHSLNRDGPRFTFSPKSRHLGQLSRNPRAAGGVRSLPVRHMHHEMWLTTLTLDRTMVGDAGLGHLVSLKKLRTINLAITAVTDSGGDACEHGEPRSVVVRHPDREASSASSRTPAVVSVTPRSLVQGRRGEIDVGGIGEVALDARHDVTPISIRLCA
jgi:hypothetical protein